MPRQAGKGDAFPDTPSRMPNPMQVTVAVAQIASTPGDIDANRRKHVEVIGAARSASVDVLVFPELSLVGHGAGPDALKLALRGDDPVVTDLARAAGPMCTVFGLVEEGPGAQFYNSALAVRDGGVVAVHRKINLATYGRLEDGKHFAAGGSVGTFELTPAWRAGMMICADLWNPPLVHLAALQGATILLAPVSSAIEAVGADFDNPMGWDINLRFHALTYGLPIAMANRTGREGDLTFWGGSRIVDPFGRTLARAEDDRETLVRARIEFEDVRRARYLLPTIRDANLPLLRREIERIATRPMDRSPQ
jgi:predicted amidohydrolase